MTTHVEGDHPDWKSKVNSPSSEVSTNLGDLESSSAVESGNSGSSHSNSNWFSLMRSSFQVLYFIIDALVCDRNYLKGGCGWKL